MKKLFQLGTALLFLLPFFARASQEESGEYKETPLIIAIRNKDYQEAEKLLQSGANVDEPDSETHSPLMVAAMDDNIEGVKFLLKHGAKINLPAGNGHTPLMAAAYVGADSSVKYLIEHGANICEISTSKESALSIAEWNEKVNHRASTVKILHSWLKNHSCKIKK